MRLLLSSVCKPIGPRYGDGAAVGYELLHAQVTRAQGIFSPRAVHLQYGLEYIASNLSTPTVTLHYPSEADFVRELQTGGYSHVGIAFNLSTSHRMRMMARLVRRYAPGAVIVLGGYGTVLPDEELLAHGDVICRGEGVEFMRDLLGEAAGQRPYDHPLVVSRLKVLSLPVSHTGIVFGGLGCPNGCDFCCTSHFYNQQHIRLLPRGEDLFEVVRAYREIQPDMEFTVLDEDFLLNRKRALAFGELIQEAGMHVDMFAFASVRALSRYSVAELVKLGIGGVWLGFEGSRSGYAKREGRDVAELVADLKRHGILVLASMIIGLDYQTPDIVRAEFEELMSIGPTLSQFLIYGPTPGTPLGIRTEAEDLWLPEYRHDRHLRWRKSDGFTSLVRHPHMAPGEIEALQEWCFKEDYRRQGPSILRTVETWHAGWRHLQGTTEPGLRRRAEYLRSQLAFAPALLPIARVLAPSRSARRRLGVLDRALVRTLPRRERWTARAMAPITVPAAAWTAGRLWTGIGREPPVTRHDWAGADRPPVAHITP